MAAPSGGKLARTPPLSPFSEVRLMSMLELFRGGGGSYIGLRRNGARMYHFGFHEGVPDF